MHLPPSTSALKPETQTPNPETRNPNPEIQSANREALNPECETVGGGAAIRGALAARHHRGRVQRRSPPSGPSCASSTLPPSLACPHPPSTRPFLPPTLCYLLHVFFFRCFFPLTPSTRAPAGGVGQLVYISVFPPSNPLYVGVYL